MASIVAPLLLAAAIAAAAPAGTPAAPPPASWIDFSDPDAWHGDARTPLPLQRVARGATVRGLPVAERQIAPTWTWGGRRWSVEDYMAAYRVSGVLVLKDGEVVLERYGLGRQPADRWVSQSVAKSVTSLLAGAAIADGRLRLEDPIVRLVPELAGSAYDGVTVRQLLMMSSGVRWNEDYTDPRSDLARFYAYGEAGDALLGFLRTLPRARPPGSAWRYNTAETHLAGLVIARAVGRPLAAYLSEKIWKPYGMERDAWWMGDRQGRALAGCCLSATLADYARIGQFVLDDGRIDGRSVLAPGWIGEATRVQIANDQPAPSGYGYFWWIGPSAFEASGIFGQSILIDPKARLVIAVNAAWPRPVGPDLFAALQAFQRAVREAAAPGAGGAAP